MSMTCYFVAFFVMRMTARVMLPTLNISLENVIETRNEFVSEIETSLEKVSNWGRLHLVRCNLTKTQACTFIA